MINATTPLFPGVEVPFSIVGDTIRIDFPLPVDRLRLGPLRASWASLSVAASPRDLELTGGLGFEIEGLGSGALEAGVTATAGGHGAEPQGQAGRAAPATVPATQPSEQAQREGFFLSGMFQFEFDKLDPAEIRATYQNDRLAVEGTVGIKQNAIPGISAAQVHVAHDDRGTTVDGTATLDIPGLEGTQLQVSRDRENRIAIGADNVPLPVDRLPGVRSATASIHAERAPTGDWSVRGSGQAQAGVPGLEGQILIDIDGHLVTVSGGVAVQRGIMSGRADILVTNRPRTPDGRPTPGRFPEIQPTEISLTGHGEVTLQLGRLLRGTVGITILPNEEIELSGTVALPPTVDVFPQRSFERTLFAPPPIDIPILGIAAAGHRIGIFATLGGSLKFVASLGPGQLRDTALTVDYNPSHPERASVHGESTFFVPAEAGLRLAVHAGIGAGLAIASVEGGLEVGAKFGIAAEASAHVAVDWTPTAGVSLDAAAHFAAQPQFTFDANAYVSVNLDLLLTDVEVYSNHWNLASFTWGPALQFGLDIPVHWGEQTGLDFDPSRVQVQVPDIDIPGMIEGLAHRFIS